ncbi:WD40/YVTN/BNR-like repeat-containing protein [Haloferula sp.]|uniref:WD40/YVTN/BNR-like repeat-containing protein n=1 Tax=Haloferula sp. TaxID=2497595 RepID=UPI00329DBBB7
MKTKIPHLLAVGFLLGSVNASFADKITPPPSAKEAGRFPSVSVVNVFEPKGESNVRSSFRLSDKVGLIGTEETADLFKTEDGGSTWRKVLDGKSLWKVNDIRNFIRADDGHLYFTTSDPGIVCRSEDEGENWKVVAKPKASRTVGLVQLDDGTFLVGLRRAEQKKTSLIRSDDHFETETWIKVSDEDPPQNTTCFHNLGGTNALVGVGYEASGKIYKSTDSGLTWTKKADFPEARDTMWFFQEGKRTYLLASGVATLYVSEDEGETWAKDRQFWKKGFLGMSVPYKRDGKNYRLMCATDQTEKPNRHVILISDDAAKTWFEWIELDRDKTGGASNLSVLSPDRIIAGTGNHSAQGKAFTLEVK